MTPIHLALLWHHHQPLYRVPSPDGSGEILARPWVRLHAIRDYYSMAALVAERPDLRVTFNLTPVLLEQLDDYVERGLRDRSLDLTLMASDEIGEPEAEEILGSFFDADWHNQISPHPRYEELFERRKAGASFAEEDLRDLRMWFNLAWFGSEFREGPVELVTGERVTVHRFVEMGEGFTEEHIREMVRDQHRIMEAVVPIHRELQDAGRIEVVTTPYFHPILPLLVDTDSATVDRPGTRLPRRFAFPEDAREQVRRAVADYEHRFGRAPGGIWPAEEAVSEDAMRILAETGARWTVTDQGVLARSGRWGYEVGDPAVSARPYRFPAGESELAVFFRNGELSDRIAFWYGQGWDPDAAARDFADAVRGRGGPSVDRGGEAAGGDAADRVVTVALDGENSWGGYSDDGRPFLRALYRALEEDSGIRTVSFREYLEGNEERGVRPHSTDSLERVYELFTASWIDEPGSEPGVDLGTWIGEEEENRGWELLLRARGEIDERGGAGSAGEGVMGSLLAAEGSDWFWWFGQDQESQADSEFDEIFRAHLRRVYEGLEIDAPPDLSRYIVKRAVVWSFAAPVDRVEEGDSLIVRTNCPGVLRWWLGGEEPESVEMTPGGGAGAGARRFQATLGPLRDGGRDLHFRFECHHPECQGRGPFCSPDERIVRIQSRDPSGSVPREDPQEEEG